jgi:uncharacterized Zn finger protein
MPRRGGGWDYYGWYERTAPREVKGGIKARSKRGTFGESWWAKRWIAVLESFDIGARLGRGRSYARRGQVVAVDIAKGKVTAKVQGSRPTPYGVTIAVETLGGDEWKKVAAALSAQAIFAAKLLAGEMPQEIEAVFTAAGVSLFPEKSKDLETSCSCPDWSNPCKHVAAVYYLLGEEFDRDPFLIFKLRGMTRDELVAQLGAASKPPAKGRASKAKAAGASGKPAGKPEPLAAEPSGFWGGGRLPEGALGEARVPPVAAALPRRLGGFPFWRGASSFLDALEPIYTRASERALDSLAGDRAVPITPPGRAATTKR